MEVLKKNAEERRLSCMINGDSGDDLLKIRDDPRRSRRLSSIAPKMVALRETRIESKLSDKSSQAFWY